MSTRPLCCHTHYSNLLFEQGGLRAAARKAARNASERNIAAVASAKVRVEQARSKVVYHEAECQVGVAA